MNIQQPLVLQALSATKIQDSSPRFEPRILVLFWGKCQFCVDFGEGAIENFEDLEQKSRTFPNLDQFPEVFREIPRMLVEFRVFPDISPKCYDSLGFFHEL